METNPGLIEGKLRDLGDGFMVRHLPPVLQARDVGPLVFFDHTGPVVFGAGKSMDARPHPHIGLATVSWLFEGASRHRGNVGSLADIRSGEGTWMTAARGIAHSGRTPPASDATGRRCTARRYGWRCHRPRPRSRQSFTITSALRCRDGNRRVWTRS